MTNASYYMIDYEKFRNIMQQIENEALIMEGKALTHVLQIRAVVLTVVLVSIII